MNLHTRSSAVYADGADSVFQKWFLSYIRKGTGLGEKFLPTLLLLMGWLCSSFWWFLAKCKLYVVSQSQNKKLPLLMVMSYHGEFSFYWDCSCGELPFRSPAIYRFLNIELPSISLASLLNMKSMRVPCGPVPMWTSLPSWQAHQ